MKALFTLAAVIAILLLSTSAASRGGERGGAEGR